MPIPLYYKSLNDKNLNKIKEVLNSGGIMIYPTETLWAIGCNAGLESSVKKIYNIKKRSDSSPIISLISSYNELTKYINEIKFDPKSYSKDFSNPPTIIYPNCKKELSHLSNLNNEIAFRVTPIDFLKKIIDKIGSPLCSTSANISGQLPTKKFKSINNTILNSVDLILNFKLNLTGKPSTIIKIDSIGEVQYIRK